MYIRETQSPKIKPQYGTMMSPCVMSNHLLLDLKTAITRLQLKQSKLIRCLKNKYFSSFSIFILHANAFEVIANLIISGHDYNLGQTIRDY